MKNVENSDSVKACLDAGNQLRQQGKLSQAIEKYQQAVNIKPSFWAYKSLGDISIEQKHWEVAISAYESAVKLLPDKTALAVKLYHDLGLAYAKQADWENALTYLIHAQQLELPGQRNIYKDIGNILQQLGRTEDAKRCIDFTSRQIPINIIRKYSQLPLNWTVTSSELDMSGCVTYQEIYSSSHSTLKLPKNLDFQSSHSLDFFKNADIEKKLIHPKAYVVSIKEGRAWNKAYTSAVITPDNQLLTDLSFGSSHLVISSESKLPSPYRIDGTAVLLIPSVGASGYCHWIIDYIFLALNYCD